MNLQNRIQAFFEAEAKATNNRESESQYDPVGNALARLLAPDQYFADACRNEAPDLIRELQAENESLRADADRYRYIRAAHERQPDEMSKRIWLGGEELDREIDAQRGEKNDP